MHEQTKGAIITAVLLMGLLAIIIVAMAKGQKEVPDDRPRPSHTASVSR